MELLSDSQALAALCTTGAEDLAAVFGAHTGKKTVNAAALGLFRLKRSFHGIILLKLVPGSGA